MTLDEFKAAVAGELELRDSEVQLAEAVWSGRSTEAIGGEIRAEVVRGVCVHAADTREGQIGRLLISGASIEGSLDLIGLQLDLALRFKDTTLKRIVLTDTRLLALDIFGGSAQGIEGNRAEIGHDMVLGDGFVCEGRIWMPSARIGGDLKLGHCELSPPEGSPSLLIDGARVGGRVYLQSPRSSEPFIARRGVLGRNCRIAGGLLCHSGVFEAEVDFTRSQVQGLVGFDRASIAKDLRLEGVETSGNLSFRQTAIEGPLVDLSRVNVQGTLRWEPTRVSKGDLLVDLAQARVRFLADDLDRWYGADLRLQGLEIGGVRIPSGNAWIQKRINWLNKQEEWSPTPYDAFRLTLLEEGQQKASRDVAVARERARLTKGDLALPAQAINAAYWAVLGYGYRPLRFFVISVVIVAGFAAYYSSLSLCDTPFAEGLQSCGDFLPPAAGSSAFSSVLFSVDVFLPIDLEQVGAWSPVGTFDSYAVAVESLAGWIFAGLLLGAATGVLRRD